MTVPVLIQARMGSARLPGKVLRPAHGLPMLSCLIERLRRAEIPSNILVATTNVALDDALADWCQDQGIDCRRGAEDDVARRLLDIADQMNVEAFVRVSGDSPLLDPALVDRACRVMRAEPCDLVTNVFPRTFPPGQSVEVIRTEALRRALADGADGEEREHVTLALYRNAARYGIRNFEAPGDWAGVNLAVDTAEDFARFERLLDAAGDAWAQLGVAELVELAQRIAQGAVRTHA